MRPRDVRLFLFDVARACELFERFTRGRSFEEYEADPILRSAVERQFEVAGKALKLTVEVDPKLADRITASRRVIAFRNRLIHGYASVSDEVVWGMIERHLSPLRSEVEALLQEREE